MTRRMVVVVPFLSLAAIVVAPTTVGAVSAESKVTVGSPTTPYLPNGSNEPALAMDANHPEVLAAGANDLVDNAPCQGSSCDLTPDIGISGIYFSFDQGGTWTQPTYTGLTAQNGTTHVGPIHTLPNYFEHGMSSHGDPALAFGPKPGPRTGSRGPTGRGCTTPTWPSRSARTLVSRGLRRLSCPAPTTSKRPRPVFRAPGWTR